MPVASIPVEAKDEEKQAAPASDAVKAEPEEDAGASASKKRVRPRKDGDAKDEEDVGVKRKKDEEEEADEQGNAEDAMAPEAEPTCERNEVPAGGTKFREDAVHVYGLDFLKTGHMEEIFGQFNHRFVEWINDSSANVVFRDAASARKALESLSYPKAGDDPWRRTPDILVHDDLPAVFLQMRLAALSDSKSKKKSVPSMNPPSYVEESQRRNPQFTITSLYDKRERPAAAPLEKGKRRAAVLPDAEIAKRSKRGERFAATLGEPQAPPAAESKAADAPTPAATEDAAATADADASALEKEEEAAKRQERARRFGEAGATEAKLPASLEAEAADASASRDAEAASAPKEGGAPADAEETPAAETSEK